MMATTLKRSREREAKLKCGGQQRLPTADTAGRDAVSLSFDRSDDCAGSRKEERDGPAEADPTGGQPDGRGRDWGFDLSGDLSITPEGLHSRPFLGQSKMAIPFLKWQENFGIFRRR